jgi:hypothetical protein
VLQCDRDYDARIVEDRGHSRAVFCAGEEISAALPIGSNPMVAVRVTPLTAISRVSAARRLGSRWRCEAAVTDISLRRPLPVAADPMPSRRTSLRRASALRV